MMRFHKLRIAGLAACYLAGAFLIALWIRTFFVCDSFSGNFASGGDFIVTSRTGAIGVGFMQRPGLAAPAGWNFRTVSPDAPPTFNYSQLLGFAYAGPISSGKFAARVPYWFLILATTAMFRALSKGFVWRFSLRTLLIATTLTAAVLGLAVYVTRK
jgi:hypothetical protein